ncbi:hypothetical protein Egran_04930 [Elaphomyces granulatus]|uniref:Uncharacterized protein n=1 Tax=Elaphomyces granulatus TaxID=519963 RepID=A0A232LT33_9EURO|nr:hypothetical protein Egran_04930 [Elaphomyces granulatus]
MGISEQPLSQPHIKFSEDQYNLWSPKNPSLSSPPSSAKNLDLEKRASKDQPVTAIRNLPTAEELKAYEAYEEQLQKMSLEELNEHIRKNNPHYVFHKSACYTEPVDIEYESSLANDEETEDDET